MRDVASGSALAAIAIAAFAAAWALPAGVDEPGPAFFPLLLAGALFCLSVTIVCRGWTRREPVETNALTRPAAVIAATVAYVAAFSQLGFVAATLGYSLAVSALVGQRGARLVVVPAVVTGALYAAFVLGLGVPMP